MKRFDILTLGSKTYKRYGWFWVPMTDDDFAALDAAETRRDNIGWAITFALAALAFAVALAKHLVTNN